MTSNQDSAPSKPSLKTRLRRWVPPDFLPLVNAAIGRGIRFKGDYPSWAEAKAGASGYQAGDILEHGMRATELVRDGKAAWDRDGVASNEPRHAFALLAALLKAAAENRGDLSVLDFGGGLGSTYFQARPFLADLPSCRWAVVEQEHYVKAGRRNFANAQLVFHASVAEAVKASSPNAALFCSVLQYLDDPKRYVAEVLAASPTVVVFDRTPVVSADRSIITVQHVPKKIVKSSYPARLFARGDLLAMLTDRYTLAAEYSEPGDVIVSLGHRIALSGMIFFLR